jgi:hypothetical protein
MMARCSSAITNGRLTANNRHCRDGKPGVLPIDDRTGGRPDSFPEPLGQKIVFDLQRADLPI